MTDNTPQTPGDLYGPGVRVIGHSEGDGRVEQGRKPIENHRNAKLQAAEEKYGEVVMVKNSPRHDAIIDRLVKDREKQQK